MIVKLTDLSTSVTTDTLSFDLKPYFGRINRGHLYINFNGATGAITNFKIKPNGKDQGNPNSAMLTEMANYVEFFITMDETLNGLYYYNKAGGHLETGNIKVIETLDFLFTIANARICTATLLIEIQD